MYSSLGTVLVRKPDRLIIPSLSTGAAYPQSRGSEEIQRNIQDHRRLCSWSQSTTTSWVVDCEHDVTKRAERKEDYKKTTEAAKETYEELPIDMEKPK